MDEDAGVKPEKVNLMKSGVAKITVAIAPA